MHQATDPNVWNDAVREYPWFSTRSTLSSSPPSPTVEKGPEVPALRHPRPYTAFNPLELPRETSPFDDPIQPVPTFDSIPQPSYQPTHGSYDGLHFASMHDPPPIISPEFTRTREAPKPPVSVHSLYPEHMQAQLPMDVRNNLYGQSMHLEGQEPSPIGDWPRSSRNNSTTIKYSRRQPPPPPPFRAYTEPSALTQEPPASVPRNQRSRSSGTTKASSPVPTHRLGSPIRGPQWTSSSRRHPPPPLNLDGISNTSYQTRR